MPTGSKVEKGQRYFSSSKTSAMAKGCGRCSVLLHLYYKSGNYGAEPYIVAHNLVDGRHLGRKSTPEEVRWHRGVELRRLGEALDGGVLERSRAAACSRVGRRRLQILEPPLEPSELRGNKWIEGKLRVLGCRNPVYQMGQRGFRRILGLASRTEWPRLDRSFRAHRRILRPTRVRCFLSGSSLSLPATLHRRRSPQNPPFTKSISESIRTASNAVACAKPDGFEQLRVPDPPVSLLHVELRCLDAFPTPASPAPPPLAPLQVRHRPELLRHLRRRKKGGVVAVRLGHGCSGWERRKHEFESSWSSQRRRKHRRRRGEGTLSSIWSKTKTMAGRGICRCCLDCLLCGRCLRSFVGI
ncbi:hypothetical protein VPH35_054793 [Triticum aestivum]